MMKKISRNCMSMLIALWCTCLLTPAYAGPSTTRVYEVSQLGLKPNTKKNASPILQRILKKIKAECHEGDSIVIRFEKGIYHFQEKGAAQRTYYISNHDQTNPKKVGISLEDMQHVTLDGGGSQLLFYGRMLPISLVRSSNCTLQNFSIDFENPHIAQVTILENTPQGIIMEPAPWVKWRITKDSLFENYGEGWAFRANFGIAFEENTKHLAYQSSDVWAPNKGAYLTTTGKICMPYWKADCLTPGTRFVIRSWERPAPGIFLSQNRNTFLHNVKVHYAEGMGLLAQLCENITLDQFKVCLRGEHDPRYFTTQADATHFSGCKGKIISCNGLYEGMMDDAINVHGTYLKVTKRIDNHTLIGRYMHEQSWGFDWGYSGDEVQFVKSATMELTEKKNHIKTIYPYHSETAAGAREFVITFENPIEDIITETEGFGIENLTWTPEVYFAHNIIRNNRARGALFSTPQKTLVEYNLFDHTSGTAILLCGDCNGWYETGACRQVMIRHNRFVNALTSLFQFTEGVISIYPEIPNLETQQKYFHGGKEGGIIIEENEFITFGTPLLYAKSVDGLIFRHNKIQTNHDYNPFHKNKNRFKLERVTNVQIEE